MNSYKVVPKPTTKNKLCIVCENYIYYHKLFNEKSKTTRWVCGKDDCSSSITTDQEYNVIKVNGKKFTDVASITTGHEGELWILIANGLADRRQISNASNPLQSLL